MDQKTVAEFFDRCAPTWDAGLVRREAVIEKILDHAGIRPGIHVLDVACGTGVLFPDYFARGVASLTAIDLSPEMVRLAREKFPQVNVLCGDALNTAFDRQFDAVVIYNAFPHFPEPEKAVERLARWVKPGGRFTVAHGMSRAALLSHHSGTASRVSIDLLQAPELAKLFAPYYQVDVVISDEEMYQVCGIRKS